MDKTIFYERLTELAKKSGKSMNCIEEELKYPRNALSNYKNNVMPSANRLIEISQYFGVTPHYLIGLHSVREKELTEIYFDNLSFEKKIAMYENAVRWMMEEATSKRSTY